MTVRSWLSLPFLLAAALALTALAVTLHVRLDRSTGLLRTIYPEADFRGEPLSRTVTGDVSLSFLDRHPSLRRRPFSVRWTGVWFFPDGREIEIEVAGGDSAAIRFDGGLLVRHPARGRIRSSWTGTIGPGAHDIVIEYERRGRTPDLRVRWAPAGAPLRPLDSLSLFPEAVDLRQYWIGVGLRWLHRGVALIWLIVIVVAASRMMPRMRAPAAPSMPQARSWKARASGAAADSLRALCDTEFPRPPEIGRRIALVAAPALLGPVVVLLVGPHTLYVANEGEFNVAFGALVPRLLLAAAAGWAVLLAAGGLLAVLSGRLTRLYAALLFVGGLLAWAQGTLIVGEYGLLTGDALDLSRQAWREPYELVLWALALAGAAMFSGRVSAVAPSASTIIVALQLLALVASPIVSAGNTADDTRLEGRAWRVPPEPIYRLSRGQNVVHIVLDAFASTTFGEIVAAERDAVDRSFSGFVFFADHLGAFPTTKASMPAMLSGRVYRNERPFRPFQLEVLERASIFTALARHGFAIHSMTFHHREQPPARLPGGDVVAYTIPTPYSSYDAYLEGATAQLLDLSLFRHVPHALKPRVYNDDAWLVQSLYSTREAARHARPSNHALFLDEFIRRLSPGETGPVYTYIHVAIPHPPLVLNADCSFTGRQRWSPHAYVDQARCGVTLVQRLLDRLRELGLYDRSLVIVTADHGWRLRDGSDLLQPATTPAGALEGLVPPAMPLLAVKPPEAAGPLRISEAPTAITDIPATILDLLGLPGELPGESVFRLEEGAARPRVYAHHPWDGAGWQQPYFRALWLFSVDGRVADRTSWRFRQAIFPPADERAEEFESMRLGLAPPQSGPDGTFRWSDPYVVTYAPAGARTLAIEVRKAPGAPRQALAIRVNGLELATHALTDAWQVLRHPLPAADAGIDSYTIELRVSPPWAEEGRRPRGAMFRSIEWRR